MACLMSGPFSCKIKLKLFFKILNFLLDIIKKDINRPSLWTWYIYALLYLIFWAGKNNGKGEGGLLQYGQCPNGLYGNPPFL